MSTVVHSFNDLKINVLILVFKNIVHEYHDYTKIL